MDIGIAPRPRRVYKRYSEPCLFTHRSHPTLRRGQVVKTVAPRRATKAT